MKNLFLIFGLFFSLTACTSQNESVIVEVRSTGLFSNDIEIDDLGIFLRKIKTPGSRELVFLVKDDASVYSLKEAIKKSENFDFKSVSVTSL